MTTPQSQCTNLELSKKLKELGYPQESLFYWQQKYQDMGDSSASYFELTQIKTESVKGRRCFSAPTVAELDSNLPYNVERPHKTKEGWVHALFSRPIERMPDAWAEVIAYLLENKLIEL